MKILITGATGFIGSHLTKSLSKQGYHCRCLVRNKEKAREVFKNYKNVNLVVGDITDPQTLKGIDKDIDIVLHLAALLGDYHNKDEEIWNVNTIGTINLLNNTKLKKIIYCSTPGVQGLGIKNATEELPYKPRGVYEESKMAAEESIIEICNKKLIKWIIFRPDFVYGPFDYRRVPLYKKIKNRKMLIISRGNNFISPTYIDDLVNAFIQSIHNDNVNNNIFNISGENITISYFFYRIANTLGTTMPKFRIPMRLSVFIAWITQFIFIKILKKEPPITKSKIDFLTKNHSTNNAKMKQYLYTPQFSFDSGINKTIRWCNKMKLL